MRISRSPAVCPSPVLILAFLSIHAAAADLTWNATLRFNWTLATTDCPVALSGWIPRTAVASTVMDRDRVGYSSSSIRVQFIGDGIAYYGTSNGWPSSLPSDPTSTSDAPGWISNYDDPTFNPSFQGVYAPARDGVLWERNPPRFKEYEVQLSANQGNWTLAKVELMTGMQSEANSFEEVPRRTEPLVNETTGDWNDFFTYTGRWEVNSGMGRCFDKAVLSAAVPPGTGYVVIDGTRGPSSRAFDIKLEAPSQKSYLYSIVDTRYTSQVDALLYMVPLDPDAAYNLTFGCVSSGEGENGIRSVSFYEGTRKSTSGPGSGSGSGSTGGSGSSGPSSSSNPGGGDGGDGGGGGVKWWVWLIVVLGVLALAAALAWWWWRKRRARRARLAALQAMHSNMAQYTSAPLNGPVDVHYEYEPTPYTTPPMATKPVPPITANTPYAPAPAHAPIPQSPHAQDAGPAQLPPMYNPGWKGA